MSNDSTGRTSRSTGGNAPMGSTVAIVVTAVAVILGFLILKKVNDNGNNTGSKGPGPTAANTIPENPSSTALTTTTIAAAVNLQATKVQVANASKVTGVAKQLTTALSTAGFDMSTATNATNTTAATTTKVIYNQSDPNAQQVAKALAQQLGCVAVEVAANPPPVKNGAFAAGSAVIVLLGTDLAGKALPGGCSGAPAGTPTT